MSSTHSYNIQAKLQNGVLSIFVHDTMTNNQWRQEFTQISFPGHKLYDVAKSLINAIKEMLNISKSKVLNSSTSNKPVNILIYNGWCYLTIYKSELPSFALRPIHNLTQQQNRKKGQIPVAPVPAIPHHRNTNSLNYINNGTNNNLSKSKRNSYSIPSKPSKKRHSFSVTPKHKPPPPPPKRHSLLIVPPSDKRQSPSLPSPNLTNNNYNKPLPALPPPKRNRSRGSAVHHGPSTSVKFGHSFVRNTQIQPAQPLTIRSIQTDNIKIPSPPQLNTKKIPIHRTTSSNGSSSCNSAIKSVSHKSSHSSICGISLGNQYLNSSSDEDNMSSDSLVMDIVDNITDPSLSRIASDDSLFTDNQYRNAQQFTITELDENDNDGLDDWSNIPSIPQNRSHTQSQYNLKLDYNFSNPIDDEMDINVINNMYQTMSNHGIMRQKQPQFNDEYGRGGRGGMEYNTKHVSNHNHNHLQAQSHHKKRRKSKKSKKNNHKLTILLNGDKIENMESHAIEMAINEEEFYETDDALSEPYMDTNLLFVPQDYD